MKTFATSAVAAAVALVGSAAMAQGTYPGNFGARPHNAYGTTPGCTNGSCGVAGCPDGQCGPMGCPDGKCGTSHGHYGIAARYPQAARPRSAAVGYAAPMPRPFYNAPSASCPNGQCPQPSAVSHTAAYRPYPTPANCADGRCATTPVARPVSVNRQPTYQAPRFNFLGLNW